MENLLLGNVIESGNISPFSCPFCGYNGSLDLMGADRFPVLRTLKVIRCGKKRLQDALNVSPQIKKDLYIPI
mgnify:CR=1 FL=1